ncbi:MAG TPA: valine--tRNA ligase, partial [Candidatus Tyrphobacter sp.]
TRPETMLGDVAIAVHPDDERYRAWIGKAVLVPPLLGRSIPVIADASVDPAFGSGAVKITPAHDAADYEIGERHALPMPSVLDQDARISGAEIDVGPYAGLDRFEARGRIVAALRESGLLVKEEAYRQSIAVSERTGAIVEPLLLEQWFVRAAPLAKPALDAYRDGRIRFVPERYGRIYEQWLENIRDWNISRQVWWGHQLPVWYTADGELVVAESKEEAHNLSQQQYGTRDLKRDPDTLDTWFSSALWPFSILGWPQKTPELECWYPSQALVTGGEIIFLWVARMVMMGTYVMGKEPFADVFVAPLVFDAQGRKMSKSLGNAIDPMEIVERYGADAFRMGILRQLRLEAQEVRFQESRCEEARNFNNKIWNATRYLLDLPEGLPGALTLPKAGLTLPDRWILTRLHDTIVEIGRLFDAYDFGNAADLLRDFIWYEFCDWYVEATKLEQAKGSRTAVLSFVLNNAMRLLHPIAPFISEEVWLALPHDGDSIMTAAWPDPLEVPVDREAIESMEKLREVIVDIRNQRAELRVAPRDTLRIHVRPDEFTQDEIGLIRHLGSATVVYDGELSSDVTFAAILGPEQLENERRRLSKERDRLLAEVERGERKLANPQFVANAKPDVVEKERAKLQDYRNELARVEHVLDAEVE